LIAESGIGGPEDAGRMRDAGADGLLIGSAIMDGDPETNTRRLTGVAA
jgi:indole-3-glycerol phosphate synthase